MNKEYFFTKQLLFSLLFFAGLTFVLSPMAIKTSASEKPVITIDSTGGDENFDRIFRQARELMDNEEWAKAVEKFNQIVCDCPEKKQVDAALYWLAYCYKKQKMYKETNATIERLLKNFPDSTWTDDARVLIYQTYAAAAQPAITTIGPGQSYSGSAPVALVNQNKLLDLAVTGTYTLAQEKQLDREDEIKLAAFQSLLAADPKRAIEVLGEMLQANSKAGETLKIQIIRSLQGSRFGLTRSVNGLSTYELTPTTVVTQINPLLRDSLVKGYQSETNPKIRTEILYAIAKINDEASVNYLAQLYSTESNKDLKKAIINSFTLVPYTTLNGYFVPFTATVNVAGTAAKAKMEAETVAASRAQPGQNKTDNTNPVRELRFNKLMEIFRAEKDLELKRFAFSGLQRFVGWSNREGMVDLLVQMYDAVTDDENYKVSIINSFSSLSQNTQAVNKLIEIAKNDKSDRLRLEAIRALRNNNSPQVIKFLEDLIK